MRKDKNACHRGGKKVFNKLGANVQAKKAAPSIASKFSVDQLDALILRSAFAKAESLYLFGAKEALVHCQILKVMAVNNPTAIPDGKALAAQLLYEIALWSIRCLDELQDEVPDVIRQFAPDADVWPVLFRKKVQLDQSIIPRLEAISFAKNVTIGKGKTLIDDSHRAVARMMELIAIAEYIQLGRSDEVSWLFRDPISQDVIAACCSLPPDKAKGGEAWWNVLIQLPPLMFGDLGELSGNHPFVKMISPTLRRDHTKKQGSARAGTQRARIKDALRHAFESLIGRKLVRNRVKLRKTE